MDAMINNKDIDNIELDDCDSTPPTASASTNIGEGIGCVFIAIAVAIIIWALSGFPGIHR